MGGWEGIICFLYFIKKIKFLDVKKSIKYGVFGCVLLGLNLLLIFPFLSWIYSWWRFYLYKEILYINTYIFYLFIFCCFTSISLLLFLSGKVIKKEPIVRKTILELGIKYSRLKISEIAEKSKAFQTNIITIVKNMIKNNEIYAEYFESSQSVAFNLQANIAEIDSLMGIYEKWETERIGKKLS